MVGKEGQRADDSFMRKVIAILLTVVIGQGGAFIYLVGAVVRQQDINTESIKKLYNMNDSLGTIGAQTGMMVKIMDDLKYQITSLAKEQRTTSDKLIQIMPTVDRASRHMDYYDHKKETK